MRLSRFVIIQISIFASLFAWADCKTLLQVLSSTPQVAGSMTAKGTTLEFVFNEEDNRMFERQESIQSLVARSNDLAQTIGVEPPPFLRVILDYTYQNSFIGGYRVIRGSVLPGPLVSTGSIYLPTQVIWVHEYAHALLYEHLAETFPDFGTVLSYQLASFYLDADQGAASSLKSAEVLLKLKEDFLLKNKGIEVSKSDKTFTHPILKFEHPYQELFADLFAEILFLSSCKGEAIPRALSELDPYEASCRNFTIKRDTRVAGALWARLFYSRLTTERYEFESFLGLNDAHHTMDVSRSAIWETFTKMGANVDSGPKLLKLVLTTLTEEIRERLGQEGATYLTPKEINRRFIKRLRENGQR